MAAIVAGLIQIWLGLTNRVSQLHRVLGNAYGTGVLIGSIGGFYLAFTIPESLAYKTGLFMLNVAWLVTTGIRGPSNAKAAVLRRSRFYCASGCPSSGPVFVPGKHNAHYYSN